jgi:hypothetical protein
MNINTLKQLVGEVCLLFLGDASWDPAHVQPFVFLLVVCAGLLPHPEGTIGTRDRIPTTLSLVLGVA